MKKPSEKTQVQMDLFERITGIKPIGGHQNPGSMKGYVTIKVPINDPLVVEILREDGKKKWPEKVVFNGIKLFFIKPDYKGRYVSFDIEHRYLPAISPSTFQ